MKIQRFPSLFITFFLLKTQKFTFAQYENCKSPLAPTPHDLDGICVTRSECKVIYDIVKLNPNKIPTSVITYLIKADCGTHNGTRYVCCKNEYLSSEAKSQNYLERKRQQIKPLDISYLKGEQVPENDDVSSEFNPLNHPNIRLLPDYCQSIQLHILDDRISNGNDAQANEFQFIAFLQYESTNYQNKMFMCAGSLISDKYVLTAAHCTNIEGTILKSVRLGAYDFDTDCTTNDFGCKNPIQIVPVEEVIVHEDFNLKIFLHDIALLRLAYPVNLSNGNIAPVCLPIYSELRTKSIKNAIIIGWGSTEKAYKSSILQKASIPIVDRYQCKNFYRTLYIPVHESHICAGGRNSIDACRGDSGGPLLSLQTYDTNIIPRFIQYGVVSGGTAKCGVVSFPRLYSNVSYYMNWILNNLKE